GSGYNQSVTQSGGHASDSAVDLVSISSSDPGTAQVSVTLQVSGVLNLVSEHYAYWVYFGGAATTNATAYAIFSNGTVGSWFSTVSFGAGTLPYTTGAGGSSLTFLINKSAVGPSSTFTLNAWAAQGTAGTGSFSWLGSNYQGLGNGGGTCGSTGCSSTTSTAISGWVWIGVGLGVVILVVIVVVVLVVVLPKRRAPPPSMPPMMGASPPPPNAPPPP
ncbi:MAG: hypothetical protein L3J73_02875, partial [Thermoplasmata archaeon]|nr:hypothetical protein [Thermoplasmata archaeon]